ncbi:chromosome segregation protein SMC [Lederbergia lenta]|uniref:Chromosome partition protein Smc n=1 Tax=Lederbergia lenta TaxID=1467 RepID=A0A2X4W7U3_LEDLE|nr:chromosome segregation protein SMC [Lederbergia lenta]MEC2324249.1 chromosome segregation protein SMC [Lederbergia lenta]SQI60266.1 chromosome segregation protein SMC [Lederbergia lenta]
MYLKQLDIIGFKSFAEKVNLEFVPGVTAVVGPNGSGKSNITDAIRWVLGEQSAKSLRGGKMEDVIFAGSDSRKPLNFAEVTLTLNNEDSTLPLEYNEVSITRRVYRTGDSEYLLNKQNCRLKDIVDLFMDSGLGKEAFSIISQGKVEEILNSKSEERRTIFEEAAGVLKYKSRKKKAEVKLLETTDNLDRVNDILSELEGQIEPLKIQASIAKDYLEKKKELETHEVALTVHEIDSLHKNWEQAKEEAENLKKSERKLAEHIQTTENQLEKDRSELVGIDEMLASLQTTLLTATKDLEQLEGRREVLKERKKNATQNTAQLKKNIEDADSKLNDFKQKRIRTEKEVAVKQNALQELKEILQTKRQQLKLLDGTIEETIEGLKSDYIDVLNEQASSNNELQYLEQQLKQLQVKNNRLDTENEKHIASRNEVTEKLKEKQLEFEQLDSKLAELLDRFKIIEQKIATLKKRYTEQESMLNQAQQYKQKAESRKETLEEMEEEYIGFFQGVRELLKVRENVLTGIEGAVAELIHVPKKYELAIETALGSAMQHVVVNTEENARNAIAFLKKNRHGRATFLPLNIIKEKKMYAGQEEMLRTQEAFIGIAADLVTYQAEHAPAIKSLLGTIVVANNLAGANTLAKLLQYRYRIVTLEGDVVNPGGSMTGGATKQKSSSLLSRKSELEELSEKIEMMTEKIERLAEQFSETKTILVTEEMLLDETRRNGELLRMQRNEIESQIVQITLNKRNVDDRLTLYDLEKKEMNTEQNDILSRVQTLKQLVHNCDEQIEVLNQKIEDLTNQRNHERLSKESLTSEISELTASYAVTKEQLSVSKASLETLIQEKAEIAERKKSLEDDLDWLENEMSGDYTSEEVLAEDALKKKNEKEETARMIALRHEDRTNIQSIIAEKEHELKGLKEKYQAINSLLKDAEVKINRLDVELENRLQKLSEEYSLSYEGAKSMFHMLLAEEETRQKVKWIKLEIAELGTVNIGAIEEYERVSERYQFLANQQADLSEAKKTLFQIMNEMDNEMKNRFSTTFQAIQAQFEDVFKALFGGGKAKLSLTNPDDLLHTGVDIIAQPPGKKLQNLSLLSGGERSLTAIALLFSILKIRPVPFCVLDEVEAALDEANVHRFSQYLQRFSDETQFIVITHRQGTMQGADVLYGVTMQESGVSKLVSVKLESSKEAQTVY